MPQPYEYDHTSKLNKINRAIHHKPFCNSVSKKRIPMKQTQIVIHLSEHISLTLLLLMDARGVFGCKEVSESKEMRKYN